MPKLFGSCIGSRSGGKKSKGRKPKGKRKDDAKTGEKLDDVDGGTGLWESIVEKSMVGTGIMTDGAIVDRDGKIYGINDSFKLKAKQIKPIAQALYGDPSNTKIPQGGIKVGDRTFKYNLREESNVMIGVEKPSDAGIIIRGSKKFMIIGIYGGPDKKQPAEEMMVELQRYFTKQDI